MRHNYNWGDVLHLWKLLFSFWNKMFWSPQHKLAPQLSLRWRTEKKIYGLFKVLAWIFFAWVKVFTEVEIFRGHTTKKMGLSEPTFDFQKCSALILAPMGWKLSSFENLHSLRGISKTPHIRHRGFLPMQNRWSTPGL